MDTANEFTCPACGASEFKKDQLPNLVRLHYILNPGPAFNELILGQCTPKTIYECSNCPKPYIERAYVKCPHCNHLHNAAMWSKRNGFGHWLGLVCPTCGGQIPRLWNLTSYLLLAITAPLWWFPVQFFKSRWLNYEQRRAIAAKTQYEEEGVPKPNWMVVSLGFGLMMWVFMGLYEILSGRGTFVTMLSMLPICLVGGCAFGFVMRHLLMRKPD